MPIAITISNYLFRAPTLTHLVENGDAAYQKLGGCFIASLVQLVRHTPCLTPHHRDSSDIDLRVIF
jgi:hypothetical protein